MGIVGHPKKFQNIPQKPPMSIFERHSASCDSLVTSCFFLWQQKRQLSFAIRLFFLKKTWKILLKTLLKFRDVVKKKSKNINKTPAK